MTGREDCSCGKPFPEDGGAQGVCECCSGCSTGREQTPRCPSCRGPMADEEVSEDGVFCKDCASWSGHPKGREQTRTMTEPAHRYVVIRAAADLPDGFLPPDQEGRWYDLATTPAVIDAWRFGGAVAVATDRFERREDGATARVYEVRP